MKTLEAVVGGVLDKKYQVQVEKEYKEIVRNLEVLKKKTGAVMDEAEKEVLTKGMLAFCTSGKISTSLDMEVRKEYWRKARAKYKWDVKKVEMAIKEYNNKFSKMYSENKQDSAQIYDAAVLIATEMWKANAVPFRMVEEELRKMTERRTA